MQKYHIYMDYGRLRLLKSHNGVVSLYVHNNIFRRLMFKMDGLWLYRPGNKLFIECGCSD